MVPSPSPAISIVVPVYNVENYLDACIGSILRQTFADFEVICIDDGSTDGSPAMLDAWAEKDSRVRVVHKRNEGYGKGINLGISLARGTYLGIVEPDDFIDEHMYEKLYCVARETGADVAKGGFYYYWDESNLRESPWRHEFSSEGGRRLCFPRPEELFLMEPSIWSALYNLAWIREKGIGCQETPGASYQDTGFFLKTLVYANKICLLGEPLYFYRQTNSDSSTKHWGKKCDYLFREMEAIWEDVPELKNSPRLAGAFLSRAGLMFSIGASYVPRRRLYSVLRRASDDLKMWTSQAEYEPGCMDGERLSSFLALRRSPLAFLANRAAARFQKYFRAG